MKFKNVIVILLIANGIFTAVNAESKVSESADKKFQITWGNISSPTVKIKNLLWQDSPENSESGKFYRDAKKNCSDLTIEMPTGQINGFRLPTKKELIELYGNVDMLKYFGKGKYYTSEMWQSFLGGGLYVIDFSDGKESSIERDNNTDYYYRCVKYINKNPNPNVVLRAAEFVKDDINKIKNIELPKKPSKPVLLKVQKLTKGEFETTADFEKRFDIEKNRVNAANKESEEQYNNLLAHWNKKVNKLKSENEKKLKKVNYKQIYKDSYSKAFYEKYGNPILKDVKYDADTQIFNMRIVSTSLRYPSITFKEFIQGIKVAPNILKKFKLSDDGEITITGIYDLGDATVFALKANKDFDEIYMSSSAQFNDNKPLFAFFKGEKYTKGKIEYVDTNETIYVVTKRIVNDIKYGHFDYDNHFKDMNISTEKLLATSYEIDKKFEIPVPIKKARKFKELVTSPEFQPIVKLAIDGEIYRLIDITNLNSYNQLFIEKKAYAQAKNSINLLRKFVNTYPNSSFVETARDRLTTLQRENKEKKRKERVAAQKKEAAAQKKEAEYRAQLAQAKKDAKFLSLGTCKVGNRVINREKWSTTTSSGNVIADVAFNAATKEEFIIEFEGIVEGFLGDKVKVTINNYRIKQTKGGGFLKPKTYRKYEVGQYADKYLGKTQYYDKSRCQ